MWQQARLSAFDPTSEIVVLTKADRTVAHPIAEPLAAAGAIETSVHRGLGLTSLVERLHVLARNFAQPDLAAVGTTAVRVAESMHSAGAALDRARLVNRQRGREELVAAEVRVALDELGKVSGAVATDDVLERIAISRPAASAKGRAGQRARCLLDCGEPAAATTTTVILRCGKIDDVLAEREDYGRSIPFLARRSRPGRCLATQARS